MSVFISVFFVHLPLRVIKDFRNSIFHDNDEEEPLNRFCLLIIDIGHEQFSLNSTNLHSSFRRLRIAAYRSTAFFLRGKLGRGNRIMIPACIKKKIRELCPNPPNIPFWGCLYSKKRSFGRFSAFRQNAKTAVSP